MGLREEDALVSMRSIRNQRSITDIEKLRKTEGKQRQGMEKKSKEIFVELGNTLSQSNLSLIQYLRKCRDMKHFNQDIRKKMKNFHQSFVMTDNGGNQNFGKSKKSQRYLTKREESEKSFVGERFVRNLQKHRSIHRQYVQSCKKIMQSHEDRIRNVSLKNNRSQSVINFNEFNTKIMKDYIEKKRLNKLNSQIMMKQARLIEKYHFTKEIQKIQKEKTMKTQKKRPRNVQKQSFLPKMMIKMPNISKIFEKDQ